MPSRRKRKRERLKAEATACKAETLGGLGGSVPSVSYSSRSDLALVRYAIANNWGVPLERRESILNDVMAAVDSVGVRKALAATRAILAMEAEDLRLLD